MEGGRVGGRRQAGKRSLWGTLRVLRVIGIVEMEWMYRRVALDKQGGSKI